eukprot:scaffold10310_cov171-Amphora_coffeaeformis.AAC.8
MKRQGNTEDAPPGDRTRPREAPKKPLSAYNIYFKQERTLLLDSHASGGSPPDFEANLKDASKSGKTRKSAALFQAASRTIANRWKAMSPDDRLPYEKLAKVETEKYDALKEEYEGKRLQQMLLHERSKQLRPRQEPKRAVAGPSSQEISQTLDTSQSNSVLKSPQHTESHSRPSDALQEVGIVSIPSSDNNLDAGNLSMHPALLPVSSGAQSLPLGLQDQAFTTVNAPFLTDAQALAHHLYGQMLRSAGSERSAAGVRQGDYPQGQPTEQAFSSVPQLLAVASHNELLSQLHHASTADAQVAPDLLPQYDLLRNQQQQQSSYIHQLQDLLRRENASALRLEPSNTALSPRDLSSYLSQNDRNLNPRYYLQTSNTLQLPFSHGSTGGIDRDNLLAASLLARNAPRQLSLLDLQGGLAGNSSSIAFASAFSPESTNAPAGSGVASLSPQGLDSLRLQQLQHLLNQGNRNPASLGGDLSGRASSLTSGETGGGVSSSLTLPATGQTSDSVRRQLHTFLSQQGSPVLDSRSSSHSLTLDSGNHFANVPAASSSTTTESRDSVRLQLLARLAERTKNNEGQPDPPV